MGNVYSLCLEQDKQNRIRVKTEDVSGKPVRWRYGYDGAGRLSEVSRDEAGVERYVYDSLGRRSEDYIPLRGQGGRVFEYGLDNRLLRAGDAHYVHDTSGFRRGRFGPRGKTYYHYAPDYRLLAVQLPGGKTIEYHHDADGMRSGKYVDGELVEQYRWHDRFRMAAWMHSGRWLTVCYTQDGRPSGLFRQDGSARFILHTDQLGSIRVIEESKQKVIKEVLYDSFGNVLRDSNPYLPCPLGFAGGLHDHDTGLVRFGWRDYDPDTGRFTAKDPIGAAGGDTDWYGYCLDDPVNATDKTGLTPWYRFLDAGAKTWKYVEPWLETGMPSGTGMYEVGVNYTKKYANKVAKEAKKAGKWYLEVVDENTRKIARSRYDNQK
ncbi:MAG: RHS repeat domain-containing protein [Desulfovibrio sp.]|jgi:RHS repeat-associated protein